MSKEAMKLALELAREGVEIHGENSPEYKVCAALLSIAEAEKQEPVAKMTAHRAAYFMERFKREEKLLGPNEQAAVDFVTAMLNTHPQPNRKPLTDMEVRKLWANHAAKTHGWPKAGASPMHDIGNGLRFETPWHETEYQIFKAGYEAAHGIKE